jgi:hypothetical protein
VVQLELEQVPAFSEEEKARMKTPGYTATPAEPNVLSGRPADAVGSMPIAGKPNNGPVQGPTTIVTPMPEVQGPTLIFNEAENTSDGIATAGSAVDMTTAAQLRTKLAFQEAGILDANGRLTEQAIQNSELVVLAGGKLNNPAVVKELTNDGSNITDWRKYSTKSVKMPNGQSLQIHYYKNTVTEKIDYITRDYKVKGIVKP